MFKIETDSPYIGILCNLIFVCGTLGLLMAMFLPDCYRKGVRNCRIFGASKESKTYNKRTTYYVRSFLHFGENFTKTDLFISVFITVLTILTTKWLFFGIMYLIQQLLANHTPWYHVFLDGDL